MNKLIMILRRRSVLLIILFGYIIILSYWMLFGFGRGIRSEYVYNIIPFKTINEFLQIEYFDLKIRIRNLVGNIVIFIPFGILLPTILKCRKIRLLLIFEAGLLTLEILQLITKRGSFDVDDLILNTLGSIIGYQVYLISGKFIKEKI